jgi:hypothetical protein
MDLEDDKRDRILSRLGLAYEMHTEPGLPNYVDERYLFDKAIWESYSSQYFLSHRNREMDEVYGIDNTILLHKDTGLRLEYTVYDDRTGDYEYKLLNIFVITYEDIQWTVEDVNFEDQSVITAGGEFHFIELKKFVSGD